MTLRLLDLEAPLEDVEFPNGTKHQPVPFGPAEYKLWREIETETDAEKRGLAAFEIIRKCYPTATDDDLSTLTMRMVVAIIAHAARKIEQVRDALKNVDAVPAVATPAPSDPAAITRSFPKTNGGTSSSKSRARSGKTRGTLPSASLTGSRT